jgi:hypothetical protein
MKNVPLKRATWVVLLGFCLGLLNFGLAEGNPTDGQASSPSSAASPKPTAVKTGGTPSAADIAAAKASGRVWVNLSTGIYHRGGRWYGKTKDGKFMTADEAKKAGYKAAIRD